MKMIFDSKIFRYRDFRLMWIGEFISSLGTEMMIVALGWQLYQLTHSPSALGIIGLVQFFPLLIFSLIGGTFADAHNRKKIIYITQSTFILSSTILAVTTFTHLISPPLIYILFFFTAISVSFDIPTRGAFVPNLVEKEDLGEAMSIYSTLWHSTMMIGPAVGGFMIAWIGVGGVYAIDAISTVFVIISVFLISNNGEPLGEKSTVSLAAIKEGLSFVLSNVLISSLTILDFLIAVSTQFVNLLPVYAVNILHVGPQGLGILYAGSSAGAVISTTILSQFYNKITKKGKFVLFSMSIFGLVLIIFAFSRVFILSVLCLAFLGMLSSSWIAVKQTVIQIATPDTLKGRIVSVDTLFSIGGYSLGNFEAGLLAALITAPFALTVGGLISIGGAILTGYIRPSLLEYEEK